jgi:hypothetical protein
MVAPLWNSAHPTTHALTTLHNSLPLLSTTDHPWPPLFAFFKEIIFKQRKWHLISNLEKDKIYSVPLTPSHIPHTTGYQSVSKDEACVLSPRPPLSQTENCHWLPANILTIQPHLERGQNTGERKRVRTRKANSYIWQLTFNLIFVERCLWQMCQYFRNNKHCPLDNLGCWFWQKTYQKSYASKS